MCEAEPFQPTCPLLKFRTFIDYLNIKLYFLTFHWTFGDIKISFITPQNFLYCVVAADRASITWFLVVLVSLISMCTINALFSLIVRTLSYSVRLWQTVFSLRLRIWNIKTISLFIHFFWVILTCWDLENPFYDSASCTWR